MKITLIILITVVLVISFVGSLVMGIYFGAMGKYDIACYNLLLAVLLKGAIEDWLKTN